jgi:photosystem II stability/assembly factor-like uncharacterized protein
MKPAYLVSLLALAGILAACAGAPLSATPPVQATQIPASPAPTQAATPAAPTATPQGAWLSVNPASGGPGSQVTLEGYLPGGPVGGSKGESGAYANVCWDGCTNGLVYSGVPVTWSNDQPGHFSMQITLPVTAWLGAVGTRELSSGDYSIGVQCLGEIVKGCATQEAQISTSFHLDVTSVASGPQSPYLTLTPGQAAPGTSVQVQGWAPLVQIIGQPFGYNLAILPAGNSGQPVQVGQIQQKTDGTLNGSFQVPQFLPGTNQAITPGEYTVVLTAFRPAMQPGQPLQIAPTTFTVTGAATWASLNPQAPLWIAPASSLMDAFVSIDAGDPNHLAYCAQDVIKISSDGGKNWSSISSAGVEAAAASIKYSTSAQGNQGAGTCLSVTLDNAHPQSYFATFQTVNPQYGAPPVYYMGFYTVDGGKTWKPVPSPSPQQVERFGGFWTDGKGLVQALFGGEQQDSLTVIQTSDGGNTWNPGALVCPSSGPCLRWGPHGGSIGGMGSPLPQTIMHSNDGGKTWLSTGQTVELRMPGPKELVALSDSSAVLIDGGGQYPLQLTQDGGQTWTALSLPELPGSEGGGFPYSGLQMLPDGSLVAQPQQNTAWMLLAPGASQWCQVSASAQPKDAVLMRFSGDTAWWINSGETSPLSTPIAGLICGQ